MNIDKAKTELLSLQQEFEERLIRTHKHIYHRDEPVSPNFSEQVKQTENDELVQNLEEEGKLVLQQINHALERIKKESYEQCISCGEAIDDARLDTIPYADKCISCARVAE